MIRPVAVIALVLDATIGWPAPLYRLVGHPVGGFARFISWCERHGNRPQRSFARRRAAGIVTVVALLSIAIAAGLAIETLVYALFGRWGWVAASLFAWPGLAQRSLYDHVRPVWRALASDDIDGARIAVSRIVGRDVAALDRAGIARAAIESLAESFCDGVVAPLAWLLFAGLPGLWAYKAINTADSLIGHYEEPWRAFGWAAARCDDLFNLVPARVAGVVLCIAAPGGWRVMLRDHARHASPNAGWPEAAMAGALGVALTGPIAYDGVANDKPWIGGEGRSAGAGDLKRALAVYVRACALLWAIAGGIIWAL
ncbi:adenosylcobinamide-phosphate synthase CbiB [Stakelama sp. CBK3Z-3]|uniref:Cobalamin biosynthesis protein CobD n=1 Tax=Stakelama flava TaxID=2860338 RepID=A0ABS6XHB5_9SPHN|nr:adenosylcobinamide-phosphate synthase CbiB [Stakelama flava]MBW4329600.1 adenosylcobinamide-phosphate synthase CbiB [Stakelama flava]